MTNFTGKFPVFGKSGHYNSFTNFKEEVVPDSHWFNFYRSNQAAYNDGDIKLTDFAMAGMFRYLTGAIADLYNNGIPAYRLDMKYPKGAVVSFNNGIYVSLTDDNIKHVSQSSHWKKVLFEPNSSTHNDDKSCEHKQTTNFPIGTILTVPLNTKLDGFIDFKVGETFNSDMYPELYKALNSSRFSGISGTTVGSDLPIGSMVYSLSTEEIPTGWVEWNTRLGALNNYPELRDVLGQMANRLPFGQVRDIWLNALNSNSLPQFSMNGLFIRTGSLVGNYQNDSTPQLQFNMMPIIIDETNSLNPLGYRRETVEPDLQPAIGGMRFVPSVQRSPYVLVGRRADTYGTNDVPMQRVEFGSTSTEVTPKAVTARLLIKAVRSSGSNIPNSHKQIIRAF